MKFFKFFLITVSLLFACFVVLVPIIKEHKISLRSDLAMRKIGPFQAKAKTVIFPLPKEGEEEASPSASPKVVKEVDYYLAYPGILPDHPLYWAKMVRDRILLIFTKEPVARFERLLLYADKRIGAAEVLVKGGKESLGVSTATKAEKYLQQAAEQLEKLEEEGKMTAILSDKALRAVQKHQEILEEILEQAEEKGVLEETLELTKQSQKQVLQIIGRE